MHELPAVADIDPADAPYELRGLKAPVLRGWLLRLFCFIINTPLWKAIYSQLARSSGITQALKDVHIPEGLTFLPEADLADAVRDGELCDRLSVVTETVSPEHDAAERLRRAEDCVKSIGDARTSGTRASIRDYHNAYRSGATNPVEVVEWITAFVREHNEAGAALRWFLFHSDGALDAARASWERWQRGGPLSVLDGVPFAVKDNLDVAEYPSCDGTAFLAARSLRRVDSPAVAALRAAGAIVVGKTVMHELGLSTLGINAHHGSPRNPWNLGRVSGGSSAGSAAVVGAGLVPFALAADGGGSTRVPAALCGAVGFMATQARIPKQGGALRHSTVTVAGAITNCVEDALLLYAVLAGAAPSPHLPSLSLPHLRPEYPPGCLSGLRIGVYRAWFEDCDGEVLAACERAVDALVSAGVASTDIVIPDLELLRVAHTVSIGSEALTNYRWAFADPKTRAQMGPDIQIAFKSLSEQTATDYLQAQRIRSRMTQHMRRVFGRVDFVVTPAAPLPAPPLLPAAAACGESNLPATSALMRYAQMANFLGLPAIALPCGVNSAGLPLSFQMMAAPWHEASLLAVAAVLERATCADVMTRALDSRAVQCFPLQRRSTP